MGSREGVLTGMYILVVEDDRDGREILQMLLRYFGAKVTAAASATDALRALTAAKPAVVIVDMLLGRSSGTRVLREARRLGHTAPFIAISGKDFDGAILNRQGFAAYLPKPLNHEQLIDTILAVVQTR